MAEPLVRRRRPVSKSFKDPDVFLLALVVATLINSKIQIRTIPHFPYPSLISFEFIGKKIYWRYNIFHQFRHKYYIAICFSSQRDQLVRRPMKRKKKMNCCTKFIINMTDILIGINFTANILTIYWLYSENAYLKEPLFVGRYFLWRAFFEKGIFRDDPLWLGS